MNHWAFVTAAYGITLVGTLVASIWAWRSARVAEQKADALTSRQD